MSSPPVGASEDDLLLLGGNLAALASRAALELDNLLLGRDVRLVAVPWIASEIEDSIASQDGPGLGRDTTIDQDKEPPQLVQYDLSKVMVINRAFDAAGTTAVPLAKVADFVSKAGQVAKELRQLADRPKDVNAANLDEIERLRAFCLALAKSTLASRHSRKDSRRIGRSRR